MPIWHFKLGRSPRAPLRLHRARRRHALQRLEERPRGEGEHRDHARVRESCAGSARDSRAGDGDPAESRTCFAIVGLLISEALSTRSLFGESPKRARGSRALPDPPPMIAWTIYLTFAGAVLALLLPRVSGALDRARDRGGRIRHRPGRVLRAQRRLRALHDDRPPAMGAGTRDELTTSRRTASA